MWYFIVLFVVSSCYLYTPSVLSHFWFGNRKGIRLVKNPVLAVSEGSLLKAFWELLNWSNVQKNKFVKQNPKSFSLYVCSKFS